MVIELVDGDRFGVIFEYGITDNILALTSIYSGAAIPGGTEKVALFHQQSIPVVHLDAAALKDDGLQIKNKQSLHSNDPGTKQATISYSHSRNFRTDQDFDALMQVMPETAEVQRHTAALDPNSSGLLYRLDQVIIARRMMTISENVS